MTTMATNDLLVETIHAVLEAIPIKTTRVVWGHVVKRFSANAFEINTWGRAYYDSAKAAERIADYGRIA